MSESDDRVLLSIPMPHADPLVADIMERAIPLFAPADLQQALSVVVDLFAMAISRCPKSEREQIVRGSIKPILEIADVMVLARRRLDDVRP
jgi:hypothetical protein